jgi:hypothetical protein
MSVEVSVLPTPTQKVELAHETFCSSLSWLPGFWLDATTQLESAPAGAAGVNAPVPANVPARVATTTTSALGVRHIDRPLSTARGDGRNSCISDMTPLLRSSTNRADDQLDDTEGTA